LVQSAKRRIQKASRFWYYHAVKCQKDDSGLQLLKTRWSKRPQFMSIINGVRSRDSTMQIDGIVDKIEMQSYVDDDDASAERAHFHHHAPPIIIIVIMSLHSRLIARFITRTTTTGVRTLIVAINDDSSGRRIFKSSSL
jgi:hypothetical protein